MKKGYALIVIMLVISMSFVSASKVYSRASKGSVSISGDNYYGKNSAYFNLRENNGKCNGYLTLNFHGVNDESSAYLKIRMKPKGLSCELGNNLIFLSGNADVKYRINQRAKKVFDSVSRFGHIKWKWVKTGKKEYYSKKENVIIMLAGNTVSIYSENFGVYDMNVKKFTIR